MSKKILFLFLGVLINFLFFPQPAFAFWDWIVGAITFIPNLIVIIFLQLIILASGLLASIASALVRWVVSPNFTTLSYTQPGTLEQAEAALANGTIPSPNPFIHAGLSITQGFVNMGLVLALVFIAFATILRLPGYDTKKLLVKFLIIALLVNFAPTICGLIVDAFNIVTRYFTDRIEGLTIMTNIFRQIGDILWHSISAIRLTDQVAQIVVSIVFIIYNLLLALILLIFAFLFAVRYVAIWLAVILAPIAAVCYILPITKKWWWWWWNQFIQWSMIGVVGGFFLYLSAQLAAITAKTGTSMIGGGALEMMGVLPHQGFLNRVLPQTLSLACLYLGLALGLQTSAMGAASIIEIAKKTPGWLAKTKPARRVSGWGAEKLATGLEKAGSAIRRLEGRVKGRPVLGKVLTPVLKTTEEYLKAPVTPLLRYRVRAREVRIPREFERMTAEEQARYIESLPLASPQERIQYAARMAELKTLSAAPKEFHKWIAEEAEFLAKSPHFKKYVTAIADALPDKISAKLKIDLEVTPGDQKKMRKKIKEVAEELSKEAQTNPALKQEIEKSGKSIEDIAAGAIHVREMRDLSKISKPSLDSVAVRWGAHYAGSDRFPGFISAFGYEKAQEVLDKPGGWNQLFEARRGQPEKERELLIKFYRENPSLFDWLFTSGVGRRVKTPVRELITRDYGRYREDFLPLIRESNRIIEGFDSFEKLYEQLAKAEEEMRKVVTEPAKAQVFESAFPTIQEKATKMVEEIEDILELENIQNTVEEKIKEVEKEKGREQTLETLKKILDKVIGRKNELRRRSSP